MDPARLRAELEGCYVTIPTLFRDPDLGLDLPSMRAHVDRLIREQGIAGIQEVLSLVTAPTDVVPADVRVEAIAYARALERATGQRFGVDPARWAAWWREREASKGKSEPSPPSGGLRLE